MITNHFHDLLARIAAHSDQVPEHQAAVDLLVLTAYSVRRVSQDELEALDRFDADHSDWDQGAFNVSQYLPSAIAKVRDALDRDGGADELLAEAVGRIGNADVKAETARACLELAATAEAKGPEAEFAHRVSQALA